MQEFYIKQGDRKPDISSILTTGGVGEQKTPVDLSGPGTTVQFAYRGLGAPVEETVVRNATILEPGTAGQVKYEWVAEDTEEAGSFVAEWRVTFVGGLRATFPNNEMLIVRISESA